jgi:hypothetical protein
MYISAHAADTDKVLNISIQQGGAESMCLCSLHCWRRLLRPDVEHCHVGHRTFTSVHAAPLPLLGDNQQRPQSPVGASRSQSSALVLPERP